MDIYSRLPAWAQRAFFPVRYEVRRLEEANRSAYIASNESLMGWVFTMHNFYHGLSQTLSFEQEARHLSDDEREQLSLAQYYMIEFENLGAYISSFEEGTWVRMRMVESYIRGRLHLLSSDTTDAHFIALQQLATKFEGMMLAVPAHAR